MLTTWIFLYLTLHTTHGPLRPITHSDHSSSLPHCVFVWCERSCLDFYGEVQCLHSFAIKPEYKEFATFYNTWILFSPIVISVFVFVISSYYEKFERKKRAWRNLCKRKILQPRDKTKNRKYFITTKWVRRNERIGIFQKKELEKSKQECARQHNVPKKIMVPRMPANPSGKLKKYNSLDTHSFNAFTEPSIRNIKEAWIFL